MLYLVLGLAGFLGLHLIRVLAPQWREDRRTAWGAGRWKLMYSVLALGFFVLLVWGYGQARLSPTLIWVPPGFLRHPAMLLVLLALILFAAAKVPRNHIAAKLKHPMTLSVKTWALAHLLMSGWLHSMLLFGSFLLWAVVVFASARRRPPAAVIAAPSMAMSLLAIAIGVALWGAFAFYLHRYLIGVAPFGAAA